MNKKNLIKKARIDLNLTQKELAALVGTSNVTMGHIERGDFNSVKFGTLKKTAEIIKIPFQELFL